MFDDPPLALQARGRRIPGSRYRRVECWTTGPTSASEACSQPAGYDEIRRRPVRTGGPRVLTKTLIF